MQIIDIRRPGETFVVSTVVGDVFLALRYDLSAARRAAIEFKPRWPSGVTLSRVIVPCGTMYKTD